MSLPAVITPAALRSALRRLFADGPRPMVGLAVGAVSIAPIEVLVAVLHRDVSRATQALALVLPVVAAAVLGGQLAGFLVAVLASAAFAVALPPVGSIQVDVAEDVVAVIVFGVVALIASAFVGARLDALARLDRYHRLLLRSVSHDLRTPLASIRLASEELAAVAADSDDSLASLDPTVRHRLAALVVEQCVRLDRVVGDLLDLNRLEAGVLVLRRSPVDLVALVCDVVAEGGGSEHVHVRADTPVLATIDAALVGRAVGNLVDNAVRHSPPGSPVEVRVTAVGTETRVAVSDSGGGVSDAIRQSMLRPFRSGDVPGAAGVGLWIVQAIAELHDGGVEVTESADGGACFTLTLPSAGSQPRPLGD